MAGDQFDPIREALEGPFFSTRWQYVGCNTVESDCAERYEIAHPEPIDGTARFIGACDPYTIRALLAERDAAFAMSRCECSADEACRNLVEWRDKLAAMTAERDALQAKVEAMEKDAGRYRKLRAAWSDMDNPAHEVVIAAVAISMTESELDRALDDTPTGEKP